MDGIFISYRRDDSAGYAGRLYDRLAAHFGADRVFMDVEGIEPGLDFVDAIEDAVDSCRVLIAIIGDEWTHGTDAAGRRRLDDPNDFIRLETGAALRRGIRVVPVLVGGAVMPLATELPEELKALTRRQAIEINHKQWEASSGELIRTLEGILKNPVKPELASTASAVAAADATPARADTTPEPRPTPATPATASQGSYGRWALSAVAVVAAFAAAGWWAMSNGSPDDLEPVVVREGTGTVMATGTPTTPFTATETTSAPTVTAAVAAPEGLATAPSVAPPAPAPEPKPAPIAVAPTPTPAPAPAPAPAPSPAPAPLPAPVIRELKAETAATRARLCYRVSNAESLSLSPRPGTLDQLEQDCVTVPLDGATVFTLTARNGGKIARKTLTVVPRPVPPVETASPADTPSRTAPPLTTRPTVETAPVIDASLPVRGERWVYRSSGKWPTSPQWRVEVIVQSVADAVVTDNLRVHEPASAAGSEVRRSRGNKPDFVAWSHIGLEFSPYFGAFVELAGQGALEGLPTPNMDARWSGWHSAAKVLGRERVSVPAGSFNAYKVEVWSSRVSTGIRSEAHLEPVRVQYLIWYAPEIKRYVRMQRRVTTNDNSESEKDLFELVSHQLP